MPPASLNERSKEVFRLIVDYYVETGEPIGSRLLSERMTSKVSPATIRNVMADLEQAGFLFAPHTSAGRLPTEAGLRMFVDGLLEVGQIDSEERAEIENKCRQYGKNVDNLLYEASTMLSGLSGCAGVVMAPASKAAAVKHIEFVNLGPGRALVVIITADGLVENRLIDVPAGLPPSVLQEASNFLSARMAGFTLTEARAQIKTELKEHRLQLDGLTGKLVESGLAAWSDKQASSESALIVRGRARLLSDVQIEEDLDRIRHLFDVLETKDMMVKLLELANEADGVQIFIGSDNKLFDLSGCSLVAAPYADSNQQLVGAIGVIGPTRINYAKIIPLVDYTSKMIGKLIG